MKISLHCGGLVNSYNILESNLILPNKVDHKLSLLSIYPKENFVPGKIYNNIHSNIDYNRKSKNI